MNFADFVFNAWGWLFPALQWFVNLLINPAPPFFVDFVNEFGDVIQYAANILSALISVPVVSVVAIAVNGVLSLIQAVFNVLSGVLNLPFGVTLIGLMVIFAIICVILDFLHKCFEAIFDLASNIIDIVT